MIGLVVTLLCAVAGGLVGMIVGAIRDDDKDTEDRIKQAAWSRAMADDMVSSIIRERAALERLMLEREERRQYPRFVVSGADLTVNPADVVARLKSRRPMILPDDDLEVTIAPHAHWPLDDRGHYQAGVGYPCACGVMVEKLGDHFHPLDRSRP